MIKFDRLGWRRFMPYRRAAVTQYLPTDNMYQNALEKVTSLLPKRPKLGDLRPVIEELRAQALQTNSATDWLAAMLAQAPRASVAQIQMDKNPNGYRDKQSRLYELIDFNDTFVATVLASPSHVCTDFALRAKHLSDEICSRFGVNNFTDKQWDAIVRGLSREIAVYRAARDSGFDAYMTNRVQDALGIDMQVRDPQSRRYINIDCKTPSSFRRRLEELVHEGRLTDRELVIADQQNYVVEHNGHGQGHKIEIIVLSLLPDTFGRIACFEFVDTGPIRDKLSLLIRDHGISDDRYGRPTV